MGSDALILILVSLAVLTLLGCTIPDEKIVPPMYGQKPKPPELPNLSSSPAAADDIDTNPDYEDKI